MSCVILCSSYGILIDFFELIYTKFMKKKTFIYFSLLVLLFVNCNNTGSSKEEKINGFYSSNTLKNLTDTTINPVKDRQIIYDNRYANIPSWYLQSRIHAHTLLPLKMIKDSNFFEYPKRLAEYGVTVLARQIKAGAEGPWWPSKVGTENPEAKKFNVNEKNLAKNIIDQIHALNMKAIIYYRHTEDAEMLTKHPDWACTDVNGKKIKSPRGTFLSLNSPYRDVVITRISELAQYGADGFYFDFSQMPEDGDFSTYSRQLYKKMYGVDLIQDFNNNKIIKIGNFQNESILRFFTDLRKTLNTQGKNPVLLISGNRWPTLTGLQMNSSLFDKFILKSELEAPGRVSFQGKLWPFTMPASLKNQIPGFYLNAFSFSFMRDNSYGPPNIWCRDIQSSEDASSITAGLISLGCIPELNLNPQKSNISYFKEVLTWDKLYGEYLEDLIPYANVGILVSENQRNQFVSNPQDAWINVLQPAYQAFIKLYKNGIPVKLISDAALENRNSEIPLNVYTNPALKLNDKNIHTHTLLDFKELDHLDGTALATHLETPIFCKKGNEFTEVNYFISKNGYLYIITGPDFNTVMTNLNSRVANNLTYKQGNNYKNKKSLQFYIIDGLSAKDEIEDLVNKKSINKSNSEDNYSIYDIDISKIKLGIFRFKLR